MEPKHIKTVYNRGAGQYDSLMAEEWDPTTPRDRAVAALALKAGQTFLDVCVGTGLNFPHYPKEIRAVGIDFTEGMLEEGSKKAAELGLDVELILMDASRMSFPDETFDAVLATYALSVVPDPQAVMKEMHRVCKTGGRMVVWDSVLSDLPEVAKNQNLINPFCSKYGIPEGLIVFNINRDFVTMAEEIPGFELLEMVRYDNENCMKSRALMTFVKR